MHYALFVALLQAIACFFTLQPTIAKKQERRFQKDQQEIRFQEARPVKGARPVNGAFPTFSGPETYTPKSSKDKEMKLGNQGLITLD